MRTHVTRRQAVAGLSAAACLLAGCQTTPARTPTVLSSTPTAGSAPEEVVLPTPRRQGPMSLEEALAKRRSVRDYTEELLSIAEISQLLWACQGVTDPAGLRTAPSAGALYPLEVYLASAEGVRLYIAQGHKLRWLSRSDARHGLSVAAVSQAAVARAPAVFVITGVYQRTAQKYGDRAPLYVHLEAGHAAQNLLLQAVALGLGGVPIGAFYEQQVQAALHLPADHQPLYIIAIGHPAT